jgi:hypothetical protein
VPNISFNYRTATGHPRQYGEGVVFNALDKAEFARFNPGVLGLGDISRGGQYIQSLAAFFDLEGDTVRLWGSLPFYAKFLGNGMLFLWETDRCRGLPGKVNVAQSLLAVTSTYAQRFLPDIPIIFVASFGTSQAAGAQLRRKSPTRSNWPGAAGAEASLVGDTTHGLFAYFPKVQPFTFILRSIDFERSDTSRSTARVRLDVSAKVARDVSDRAVWTPEGRYYSSREKDDLEPGVLARSEKGVVASCIFAYRRGRRGPVRLQTLSRGHDEGSRGTLVLVLDAKFRGRGRGRCGKSYGVAVHPQGTRKRGALDDRMGTRGFRPVSLPHHRTCGFPHPAVGHGGGH